MQSISAADITLLKTAYAAFNARDIDAALATMSDDVTWPKAFKGGFVQGHDAVRAYWTEQWAEIDPHVEPVAFHREDATHVREDAAHLREDAMRIVVDVHQVVRDLAGAVLVDVHVGHRFTIAEGLIQGMEVCPAP